MSSVGGSANTRISKRHEFMRLGTKPSLFSAAFPHDNRDGIVCIEQPHGLRATRKEGTIPWHRSAAMVPAHSRTPMPPEEGVEYPICLAGKRACPPEDCGGLGGYEHLLEVIRDPDHEEYQETID